MAFRITTNGMFHAYTANLYKVNAKLQKSMTGVSTHRAFTSYADDPAAASKAFQLRRSMWRAEDQISNSKYLVAKFETAYNALSAIVDGDDQTPGLDGLVDTLSGMTATAGVGRKSLGQDLLSKSNSIALTMNIRYSEDYVFAGTDGLNPPFQWDGDTLLYRGVDVSARSDTSEYDKLEEMAFEKSFVDIGLGIQEDPEDKLIESSAFNSSLPGLGFMNYGVDADGDPKNLAVLMRQLGNLFLNTDENGEFLNSRDEETAMRLAGKLSDAIAYTQEQHVRLSADTNYLNTNMEQLSTNSYTLNEEIEDLEQREPADAIMEMYWAQYCYQASLKIGSDLLSQSLFDYIT